LIRNSLHNNGVYNDKGEKTICYNNKSYSFKTGEHIVVNWFLLTNLSLDIEECLFKIIHEKEVSNHKVIRDPSYWIA
jgi:hypothetical protein